MAHKLRPDESSGATLAFSSMARWNVSRHVPILPPDDEPDRLARGAARVGRRGTGRDLRSPAAVRVRRRRRFCRRLRNRPRDELIDPCSLDREAVKAAIRAKVIALAKALNIDARGIG